MVDRLDAAWTLSDILVLIGLFEAARRSDRGVSPRHFLRGAATGLVYRVVERRYVGRLRTNPIRGLCFGLGWLLVSIVAFRTLDEPDQYAHGAGFALGSALCRLRCEPRS